ncbi:hypothetical protein GGR57DRAFT_238262 [Xylariaceae sp. FL1272]|nr:hypothetical protein GGR57DRAFT_238262 [Xylariaceae sp. FL1272]
MKSNYDVGGRHGSPGNGHQGQRAIKPGLAMRVVVVVLLALGGAVTRLIGEDWSGGGSYKARCGRHLSRLWIFRSSRESMIILDLTASNLHPRKLATSAPTATKGSLWVVHTPRCFAQEISEAEAINIYSCVMLDDLFCGINKIRMHDMVEREGDQRQAGGKTGKLSVTIRTTHEMVLYVDQAANSDRQTGQWKFFSHPIR